MLRHSCGLALTLHRWPDAFCLPRTAAWQAPEALDDDVRDWYLADAYSFAVVLFELQTAKVLHWALNLGKVQVGLAGTLTRRGASKGFAR